MRKRDVIALAVAALVAAAPALGEPVRQGQPAGAVAPEAQEAGRDRAAPPHSGTGSFRQDVRRAWADARDGARKSGRAIGDGARSFGRATRDAAVGTWRAVKDAFSG